MITAAKANLTAALIAAGVPAQRISDDPERGKEWPPPQVPYAELLADSETLMRVGRLSARTYDDPTKQATRWTRLVRRVLPVRVRLVHRGEPDLDVLVTAFLAALGRDFRDGSQTITVAPVQTAWGGWRERPNDREQATVRVQFTGGVYSSEVVGTLQQSNVPATPTYN